MIMFSPMLDCAELPARVTRSCGITVTLSCKDTLDAIRADEFDLDIATTRVLNPDLDRDVFELLQVVLVHQILRDRHLARNSISRNVLATLKVVEDVHRAVGDLHSGHLDPSLGLDGLPVKRGVNVLDTVQGTVTVLVAVVVTGSGGLPVGIVWVDLLSGLYTKVLHIAPVEVGSGAERESENTSGIWRGCRCTTMGMRTLVLPYVGRSLPKWV